MEVKQQHWEWFNLVWDRLSGCLSQARYNYSYIEDSYSFECENMSRIKEKVNTNNHRSVLDWPNREFASSPESSCKLNDTGLITHMFANSLGGYIRSLPSHCSSLALCLTHSLCFWISVITNLISLGESLYLEVFADLDPIWEVHHILSSKKKPHLFQCFALTSH